MPDSAIPAGPPRRPASVIVLLTLLIFQGLSGLAGGFGLVADPSGAAVGIPLHWLGGSPFPDYRIPGAILFAVLGLGPLAVAWAVLRRASWARTASVLVGAALLVWIAVEILVIGYQPTPPLQLVYGLVGATITAAALRPAVRHHLAPRATARSG
jgi:hypothetical protein